MRFTVATYNIHKGFTHFTRRMVIHEVKERLHGLSADILFLQEVLGTHERHAYRYVDWYAPNVGLVKNEYASGTDRQVFTRMELVSYLNDRDSAPAAPSIQPNLVVAGLR